MNILKRRVAIANSNARNRKIRNQLDYLYMLRKLELQKNKCIYCQIELSVLNIGLATENEFSHSGVWWACNLCSGHRVNTTLERFCKKSDISIGDCKARMWGVNERLVEIDPLSELEKKYTR